MPETLAETAITALMELGIVDFIICHKDAQL